MFLKNSLAACLILSFSVLGLSGCGNDGIPKEAAPSDEFSTSKVVLNDTGIPVDSLPQFSGVPYIPMNSNKPFFTEKEISRVKASPEFVDLSHLDSIGRSGVCVALLSPKTIPDSVVSAAGDFTPTGWHEKKYTGIDGGFLYQKGLLISSSLAGIPQNVESEIFTSTSYLNKIGLIPFEDSIYKYIKKSGKRVLYRVTPVFKGTELLSRGLLLEAYSLDDEGKGLSFCVFVYNAQPDINIDYTTGASSPASDSVKEIPTIVIGELASDYDSTKKEDSKKK